MKFSSILITAIISFHNGATNAQDNTVVIGEGACQGANACQNNVLEDDGTSFGTFLNITGDGACSGASSCSDNTNTDTLWITDGCTGGKSTTKEYGACSSNQDDVSIGAQSCSGASSCSGNTHGMTLGGSACTGAQSCTENSLRIVIIGENVCTGEDSCSNNVGDGDVEEIGYYTDFGASGGSCTGIKSCRNGRGNFQALENACTGEYSCQSWKVGNNLTALVSTSLFVFRGGCTGHSSCQGLESDDPNGYIDVGVGSCTGLNSCQNVKAPAGGVELSIRDGACTEDNSCQNCETTVIGKGCQNCESSDCDGTENPDGGIWWSFFWIVSECHRLGRPSASCECVLSTTSPCV